MGEMDLTGKCGTCYYFNPIEGTARGDCHKFPYSDDVAHEPQHPFFQTYRSRMHCIEYTKRHTNADRIRDKMDDIDLAIFLNSVQIDTRLNDCKFPNSIYGWLDWLKQEVEDG